ncbi:MAG: tRNA (adenosine(37)-N6)-threonylcarbamoyltransferase complex dimerization subunit type 1 TsaB [Chloroflexi bacterium]|nr:tRNA (adenosine(37)-N6)-threonylcarbamoyltransferase complex dimerization subunit type 1 TsaB [Chloroflexota bacterium]
MADTIHLAIDTSTVYAGLAASRAGTVLAEYTWRADRDHTRTLMPAIVRVLEFHGWKPEDLAGVVVAIGPGSFNGLRVGLSVAKGLALALEVPLVGVSTLAASAYAHVSGGLPVCAIQDGGRKELAVAIYQQQGERFVCLLEEQILAPEAVARQVTGPTVVTGEVPDWAASTLRERLGDQARFVPPMIAVRRSAALAALGWQRLAAGDHDDPAALQPLYLRRPPITPPKHAAGGHSPS